MKLRVDHIAVELTDDTRPEDARDAIRQALALLAVRLAGADARSRTVERLEISRVDRLTAGRLADDLYRELT